MSERIDGFLRAMEVRLPAFWQFDQDSPFGLIYRHTLVPLRIILTANTEQDGREWVHFSMSHKERIPTWEEFTAAKDHFLGDVYAYQILPPKSKYVNINPKVLHLFHCLEGIPLPDFTRGTSSL
jgi:hypothetical protein